MVLVLLWVAAGCLVTNAVQPLTFQATLCSMKGCMRALVAQLQSESEDLQQVLLRFHVVFLDISGLTP